MRPMTTELNTMIAATLRSMPAVRITSVCATPRMPITVTCWTMSEKLNAVKKLSAAAPNRIRLAVSTISGAAVGLA